MMPVYRLTIEYDGTGWHGWQTQSGVPTIQEALETALATALRTQTPVVGSGRTDAGVHAAGQVVHFETTGGIDPDRLAGQLNGLLPRSVAVTGLTRTHDDFHARFQAIRRLYRYRISTVPVALERHTRVYVRPSPDFGAMNQAARHLLGRHDFSSFCRTSSDTINRVCTVDRAEWTHLQGGAWDFWIAADRFLHGMVRAVVGTLLQVGLSKRPESDVPEILSSLDRREAGPAAPARGLTLEAVFYPEGT